MEKISGIILITAAVLTLSACSNETNGNSKSTNSGQITVPGRGHLSAKNLTAKQNVAVITVYAANKYGQDWQKTLNIAKNNKINVFLEDRDDSDNFKGEGYIYNVGGDSTYYTISGDGSDQIIYFYDEDTYLGRRTVQQIVDYLNENRSDKLIHELAAKVTIGKDNDVESGSDNTSSFKKDSDLPGDGGLYTIPKKMIGKWYSFDNKSASQLEFTKHTMNDGDSSYELHFQKTKPGDPNGNLVEQTKDFMAADEYTVEGMKGVVLTGWVQAAGPKTVYIPHTENGHSVILEVNTVTGLEKIYWQSKELASKYTNKNFADLKNIQR